MEQLGKTVIALGVALVVIGGVMLLGSKIPGLGRLPGDISVETPRLKIYFPLATSLLISLVLSALIYIWRR